MRLMAVDTAAYPLKRATTATDTGYVGTKNTYESAGTVTGQIAPEIDRMSLEMFGLRAASMYLFNCPIDTDIRKNDRVTLTDGDYTVISVKTYKTHKTALLERSVAYGNS